MRLATASQAKKVEVEVEVKGVVLMLHYWHPFVNNGFAHSAGERLAYIYHHRTTSWRSHRSRSRSLGTYTSVWQSAFATTFTLTSPSFGTPTVTSSAARGCFGLRATMALHLMGLPTCLELTPTLVLRAERCLARRRLAWKATCVRRC